MKWWGTRLRERGIMGMNERNALFILSHNPRRLYPLVDDKLQTKRLAEAAGIAVPELYGVIQYEYQIPQFVQMTERHGAFVIKPARGSGGDGIIVIRGRRRDNFIRANGNLMNREEVEHHISNILSGMFSLGGIADKALIEYCVRFDPIFERVTYQGVPDIRTLVFRGVPVAAMARLPTHHSDGKANLHQGAIGVGIDLTTGRTTHGIWRNKPVIEHPDTGEAFTDIEIPGWERLLELAAQCYDLAALGYLGVDIVLDREFGPLVLELNARPGLSIQLANQRGLLPALQAVEKMTAIPSGPALRAALGREIIRDYAKPRIPAKKQDTTTQPAPVPEAM